MRRGVAGEAPEIRDGDEAGRRDTMRVPPVDDPNARSCVGAVCPVRRHPHLISTTPSARVRSRGSGPKKQRSKEGTAPTATS
jgi:hypothetical protein